jgi:hypothetical protein
MASPTNIQSEVGTNNSVIFREVPPYATISRAIIPALFVPGGRRLAVGRYQSPITSNATSYRVPRRSGTLAWAFLPVPM